MLSLASWVRGGDNHRAKSPHHVISRGRALDMTALADGTLVTWLRCLPGASTCHSFPSFPALPLGREGVTSPAHTGVCSPSRGQGFHTHHEKFFFSPHLLIYSTIFILL